MSHKKTKKTIGVTVGRPCPACRLPRQMHSPTKSGRPFVCGNRQCPKFKTR